MSITKKGEELHFDENLFIVSKTASPNKNPRFPVPIIALLSTKAPLQLTIKKP